MRRSLRAVGLFVALAAPLGCHHDKYGLDPKRTEEVVLPPDEPRYNLPDKAGYRKPVQQKDEKALMSRPGAGPGVGPGLGGF